MNFYYLTGRWHWRAAPLGQPACSGAPSPQPAALHSGPGFG